MDALRLPPADADVTTLSGGERRRVALCRLLLGAPDLLLLDEPTNHLDAESVAWLERHLADYKGTVVAVTHDRYFLDNVAGWILELDRSRGIPYEGNYSSWLEQKQKRLALEEKTEKARQRTIAAELDWVRQNPKGRQTKQKARLQNFEALVAQERNVKLDEVQIHIPTSTHLGNVVVEADHLRKGYGDNLLIEDLSFTLPPGGIVGVIGPNGAGKTTLFRMITGQEQPDAGTLRIGDTVQMAYVDQSRDALDAEKTVWEEISGGMDQIKVGERWMNSRAYTAGFNFKGSDQQQKVGKLSGGERNRLHLAKLLRSGGNLLLLDEPTNDLDVDTLRALEEALLSFAGCAVVISHDRWFLDRIATHVLAFEGDSQVTWFEGNFEAYEEHRRALLGDEADRPHRITYKKLTRTCAADGGGRRLHHRVHRPRLPVGLQRRALPAAAELALRRPAGVEAAARGPDRQPRRVRREGLHPEEAGTGLRLDRARPRDADRHLGAPAHGRHDPGVPRRGGRAPACARGRAPAAAAPAHPPLLRSAARRARDDRRRRARRGHRARRARALERGSRGRRRRSARTWPPRAIR